MTDIWQGAGIVLGGTFHMHGMRRLSLLPLDDGGVQVLIEERLPDCPLGPRAANLMLTQPEVAMIVSVVGGYELSRGVPASMLIETMRESMKKSQEQRENEP